ncbi:hypothetical protein DENIS_3481 [Desulfonema ishimotonii]|uniref:Uncharacterized protein n=1 Tax=Desulfonema ishimotonii TaxID=45657 RepID=A0A401FZV2_9BACT|nr:hypothetical protein [Desulfonema ishimotonii]GBC62509.1 hypothetical protein DENIS_3481 [Desulfonema ishimotonii]
MTLICPHCSETIRYTDLGGEEREIFRLLANMPPVVGRHVLDYTDLFRVPGARRPMQKSKRLRLLQSLDALIRSTHVGPKGYPARPVTPAIWGEGMYRMFVQALDLPLKNHSYLCKVVWQMADKADRQHETARNKAERDGSYVGQIHRQRQAAKPEVPFGGMSAEEMRAIRLKNKEVS